MYNLDINFLRDRNPNQSINPSRNSAQKKEPSLADKIPIALGATVLILAPAISFMYLKNVQASTVTVESEIKQIESEIADLGNQNKKIEAANAEIAKVEKDTAALVGVFEKIRPWAAIMQEVSDRTPPGVLVESMEQTGEVSQATPPPATKDAKDAKDAKEGETAQVAAPAPTIGIKLTGVARSYEDVNDFVLFLGRSPFFNHQQVFLKDASLTPFPVEVENKDKLPANATLEIPDGIKFDISAQLNNAPASELKGEIEKKGSIGLATRLNTLERKGATLK